MRPTFSRVGNPEVSNLVQVHREPILVISVFLCKDSEALASYSFLSALRCHGQKVERPSIGLAVLQAITIQSSGGLTQAEIDRMVRDAEEFAVRDQERRKITEAKNEADSLVYSSERALDEHSANLPTVRVFKPSPQPQSLSQSLPHACSTSRSARPAG
jgi:molecular chaperone DnaK (HSP70)